MSGQIKQSREYGAYFLYRLLVMNIDSFDLALARYNN
jgi:hypothetical protein